MEIGVTDLAARARQYAAQLQAKDVRIAELLAENARLWTLVHTGAPSAEPVRLAAVPGDSRCPSR